MAYDNADIFDWRDFKFEAIHQTIAERAVVPLTKSNIRFYTQRRKILPPWSNLLRIFDIQTWILTLVSIVSVSIFFYVASKAGSHYGLPSYLNELVLIPYR